MKPLKKLNALSDNVLVSVLVFKYQHGSTVAFASWTLHPQLDRRSEADLLDEIKICAPHCLIHNLQKERHLKSDSKSFTINISEQLVSHFTLPMDYDLSNIQHLISSGFSRFKLKVKNSFDFNSKSFLILMNSNPNLEFIFDFNYSGEYEELRSLKLDLDILGRCYLEDPCVDNGESWKELRKKGFQIILDQIKTSESVDFDIISFKPTKESLDDIIKRFPAKSILITNNMGDELDHRISAFWASEVISKHPDKYFGCGLYTRHFFNKKISKDANYEFLDLENQESPKLVHSFKDVNGIGWGLDGPLENLEWTFLKELELEV